MANLSTFYCHGMPISDELAVGLFQKLDIVVMCRDGSKWLHGERYDEFAHLQKAVARVKELIADKEQPTYPEHLQTLTPEQKSVYMLGEWGRAEKGETMDRILYKEANGDITCRSRDFDKVFPTLYAYEELEMTPEEIEQTLLRFSSFLMEMTGGRMSKTNYTVQAMVAEANDYQQQELDEIEEELAKVKAERDAMAAALKGLVPCNSCRHGEKNGSFQPCRDCLKDVSRPNWEWKGESHADQ